MKIKNYTNFIDQQTLYVFDFDDTIVKTPNFEELAIEFLKENLSISDLLNLSVKRIGVALDDLEWQDGRIFVKDPQNKIQPFANWVRKGDRVYMTSPDIFSKTDLSLPKDVLKLSEFYNQVENKCIVTARPESTRLKIEQVLSNFNLSMPKYGLHMLPDGKKNAGTWKGNKIVEIVRMTGFNKVIFFDDNSKYIKKASKVIKDILPNLNFEAVKVQPQVS